MCSLHLGRTYEIFGEYSDLAADILKERGARCWLDYENYKLNGFVLGRYRKAIPTHRAFVFEEVWGHCDGVPNELGQSSKRDLKRALQFGGLVDSEDVRCPILLRAATDNQFAHLAAKMLKAKSMNGLIITQKVLSRRAGFSVPKRYKLRMFKEGDQFHVSETYKAAFREILSPQTSRTWAKSPNCLTIIATHDGRPAGFIIAEKRPYHRLGDSNIAAQTAHRDTGIGSTLLKAGFDAFISLGVKEVVADY